MTAAAATFCFSYLYVSSGLDDTSSLGGRKERPTTKAVVHGRNPPLSVAGPISARLFAMRGRQLPVFFSFCHAGVESSLDERLFTRRQKSSPSQKPDLLISGAQQLAVHDSAGNQRKRFPQLSALFFVFFPLPYSKLATCAHMHIHTHMHTHKRMQPPHYEVTSQQTGC